MRSFAIVSALALASSVSALPNWGADKGEDKHPEPQKQEQKTVTKVRTRFVPL